MWSLNLLQKFCVHYIRTIIISYFISHLLIKIKLGLKHSIYIYIYIYIYSTLYDLWNSYSCWAWKCPLIQATWLDIHSVDTQPFSLYTDLKFYNERKCIFSHGVDFWRVNKQAYILLEILYNISTAEFFGKVAKQAPNAGQ